MRSPLGLAGVRTAGLWLAALCVLALMPVAASASDSVYVTNLFSAGAGGVSQYTVGAGGALSPMASPTVAAGNQPAAIAVSPGGKSVYVANEGTDVLVGISQYTVGAGGALSPMAAPMVPAGGQPARIAISPDGKSAYVVNQGGGGVSQYTVGAGGALSPMSTPLVATGGNPDGIAVSPDGRSVYVANFGSQGISQYTVGPGGALSPMAIPLVASGPFPEAIAVSPDGKSVYVANFGAVGPADGVSQYSVGPGGALSPMTTPAVAAGGEPDAIAVSPNGNTVYVTNGLGGVSQYDVGRGGALTPMTTPTVAAGSFPFSIAVSPDGDSVYVTNARTNGAGGVSQYTVGKGGALIPMAVPTVAAGDMPGGIAVVPDQGPVAAFSATTAPPGIATSFDASASRDPDGSIARYAWSFGDGSSQTTVSPSVTHVYANPGSYTAKLTVTDDIGCSTAVVYTGQTASCNGGPQAQATRQLTIATAPSAPSIQISSPTSTARYPRGHPVRANYSCHDGTGGPGIASCTGPVAPGKPINTSRRGRHSFTVTATSKDGQTTTATVRYTVLSPTNHFTVTHIKTHRNGSITFNVKVPGAGAIDVLETAWNDNLATAAVLLAPAPRRFVVARRHKRARHASTLHLRVPPNQRGKRLVRHHAYRVTLRLWVSYTPNGGRFRKQGFYGLHLPH